MKERRFWVQPTAGSLGIYEVREEVEIPGEWYFERSGPLVSRGPFQRPATKVFLHVGFADSSRRY